MTSFCETFTGSNGSAEPSPWVHATLSGSQSIQSNKWHIASGASNAGAALTYGTTVYTDIEVSVDVTLDPGGAEQYPALAARIQSGGTNGWGSFAEPAGYETYIDTNTDLLHLTVAQLGGVIDDTHTVALVSTAGHTIRLRLQCVGTTIRCKGWDLTGSEPPYWMISFTDTSAGQYASGWVGFRDQVAAAGTVTDWDNFVIDDQPAGPVKVQTAGTAVTSAAATTTVISYTGSVKPQVGDTVVVYGSRDNILNDAPTGSTDTFTDSHSNTYTIVSPLASPAGTSTAGAGIVGVAFRSRITTAWAGTETLTWTHPSTKAALVVEHWRGLGPFRTSNSAGSTAGAPSCALSGVLANDIVLGMEAIEYSTAGTSTGDADTTNGIWSGLLGPTASTGTTLAAVKVISQYKAPVSADGTQTYNPTHSVTTSVDCVAIVMAFDNVDPNLSRYPPGPTSRTAVARAANW